MDLDINFFDVDQFHELNVKRLEKLGKPKKNEDKRYKFDINLLDDKLFGKLDTEHQENEKTNFSVKPMYTNEIKDEGTQNRRYGGEKKVYASTLK